MPLGEGVRLVWRKGHGHYDQPFSRSARKLDDRAERHCPNYGKRGAGNCRCGIVYADRLCGLEGFEAAVWPKNPHSNSRSHEWAVRGPNGYRQIGSASSYGGAIEAVRALNRQLVESGAHRVDAEVRATTDRWQVKLVAIPSGATKILHGSCKHHSVDVCSVEAFIALFGALQKPCRLRILYEDERVACAYGLGLGRSHWTYDEWLKMTEVSRRHLVVVDRAPLGKIHAEVDASQDTTKTGILESST